MKLISLKGNTYVLDGMNKIGIYLLDNNEVIVIDTGFNDDSGLEIMKVCEQQGWKIKQVFITHAHPDHIGGNYIIAKTLNVPIYAYGTEQVVCNNPQLVDTIVNGGYPHKYLRNPYLRPIPNGTLALTEDVLPEGMEFCLLPGHNSQMVGFKTKDDVYFLADAVAGESVIKKYQLQFMFDVKAYFKTLDFISKLDGQVFVPSHGEITEDIKSLVSLNKETILGVIDKIKEICQKGINFDDILKELADYYHLKLDFIVYSLISCTLRCYLAYMLDEKIIKAEFEGNKLIWKTL